MPIKNILNVAVISPRYGLVGGSEHFAMEVTERLALNPNLSIHVFANKWQAMSDRITFHKYPIIKFPRFFQPISTAFFVQKMISKQKFDIIHTHERIFGADIYSIHGLPHQYWIKNIRKKKRMSLFDYYTHYIETKLVMNPRCQHLLAVSQSTKEIFCQSFQLPNDKVKIVPPGVDLSKFSCNERIQCRKDIRKGLGMSESDIVILFVGMNFEIKGLPQLMTAISKTLDKNLGHSLKLIVVGKGDFQRYKFLASQLNIQDHINFTGIIAQDIEKVYLASDIFSMLSEFDTFGMTVLEAMASGMPVIVSRNVGAKDIVTHGMNGYIVDADDTDSISSHIIELLNHDFRNTLAKAASETAQKYTWDRTTEQIQTIYDLYGNQ